MKKLTITLLCIVSMLLPFHSVADTADSLYQILKADERANHTVANSLMIMLDAEGIADTLYSFSRADERSYIMKTVALYMAYHYDAAYDYAKAASAFMEMARQAKLDDDIAAEGDAFSQAAVEFHHIGEFDEAIRVNLQALHIDSLLNDTALLSNDLSTLAATCLVANRIDEAVRYILLAIEKEESRATPTKLSIRYGHAAEIFNKKGDTEKALNYAQKAYEIDRKAGNDIGIARRLSQMADIYMDMREWKQAETCYQRAITVLEEKQERHSLTIDYKQMGSLFLKQHKPNKAIGWLLKADSLASMTGNRYFLSQITRLLANAYDALGQHTKAYTYLTKAMNLNDSIYNERVGQLTSNLRTHYELEQQRSELLRQKGIVTKQQCTIAILIGLIVALTLLFFFIRRKSTKAKGDDHKAVSADESETVQAEASVGLNDTQVKDGTYLKNMSSADRQFILSVVDYVHANMKVRKITIDQLAEEMCMSRSQFSRRIMALTKESPNTFITRIRMEKAIRLLKDTNMSIKEIAYDCGFDESNYFIRVFRQTYDMTPQQYRNAPI